MMGSNFSALAGQWPSCDTGCEHLNTIHFDALSDDVRASLQGQRWLILRDEDLPNATAAIAFSELEDVLVAVDHRSLPIVDGLWMRAVHLLLVQNEDAEAIQLRSGITKVVSTGDSVEDHLW